MAKPIIGSTTIGSLAGVVGDTVIGASIGALSSFSSKQAQSIGNSLSRFPHVRTGSGITDRRGQIMSWRLPNGNSVQMYINPENFSTKDSKQITSTRTKGGFLIQYWGENLSELSLSGTTGSSGIKGINVLRDIYRSENKGFDLIAAQQLSEVQNLKSNVSMGDDIANAMVNASENIRKRNFLLRPSLASLATNVILFYQGVSYKGYFTSFSVTESISKLGLFDYILTFMAYEVRGSRKNFMPWHKEPMADDSAGQLINAVGNLVRGAFNLNAQPPEVFHPDTAPLTFGGNSLSSGLGFADDPLTEQRTVLI